MWLPIFFFFFVFDIFLLFQREMKQQTHSWVCFKTNVRKEISCGKMWPAQLFRTSRRQTGSRISEAKPRLQVAAFRMRCFTFCKMCIIPLLPTPQTNSSMCCSMRSGITHPVHDSKDGDEQGVGADDRNPNPGESAVNFINCFAVLHLTLVPYGKRPGSSQRMIAF